VIAALRLVRVGLHLGYGMATAALVYPCIGRSRQLWLKRRWSRQLLGMLGVRLHADTALPPGPALLVANHISWLDIFAINALAPAAFVCKADVRAWPFIGWLCERTETVFMPRGSRIAARLAGEAVAERLRQGWLVAVFPEGTTSDGSGVLPFRGALLQGAVDAGCRVQPVALRYMGKNGLASAAVAYCDDTTLMQSLVRIVSTPGLQARLDILAPMEGNGAERRELASTAWRSIYRVIRQGNSARDLDAGERTAQAGVSLAAT
jgi:1-acyl-sn-glycerol-3-phosphate acyltransferase